MTSCFVSVANVQQIPKFVLLFLLLTFYFDNGEFQSLKQKFSVKKKQLRIETLQNDIGRL